MDVTEEFTRGAEEALRIAKLVGSKKAILKAKSPSCGSGKIYDGIYAELFKKNEIKVVTEDEI